MGNAARANDSGIGFVGERFFYLRISISRKTLQFQRKIAFIPFCR